MGKLAIFFQSFEVVEASDLRLSTIVDNASMGAIDFEREREIRSEFEKFGDEGEKICERGEGTNWEDRDEKERKNGKSIKNFHTALP